MIALIIFLIIVLIVLVSLKKNAGGNEKLVRSLNIFRNIAYIAIGIAIILSAVVEVGPGEVGIQVLFGSVQSSVLHSGLNIINPLVSVERMDIKTQAYTMSSAHDEGQMKGDDAITALSMDGLTLRLDVTVWYKLSEADAPQVYRSIGTDYVDKIVRPAIRTALRDIAVLYSATDIYSNKREDYVHNVTKNLEEAFNGRGVVLERVLLRTVELPEMVRTAIDEKIAAEQKAQQMVYVLQKERQEAERKKVEAQGISDFNRIVSQSITEQTLQMKGIEATLELAKSQNSKMVIMNGKNMPLIFGMSGQ
ncbi:MAG: prohibitin family protein [Ignavibacteria bacterium]|jgi:regulator of protease activity HflC (stomatin/prohibitin superfamily)